MFKSNSISCININRISHYFVLRPGYITDKYMMYVQIVSRFKLYSTEQKWIMNEISIFFIIALLAFNTFIAMHFPLINAPLKLLFW